MARGWHKDPDRPWGSGIRKKTIVVKIYPDEAQYRRIQEARLAADDLNMSFTNLVLNAVDDYITLHQHCVPREIRRVSRAPDYDRQRRTNGL